MAPKKEEKGAKEKKKSDVRKLSDTDGKKAILEYMIMQNRPYNATQVFENFNGAITKSQATKLLAALAEQGKLTEKEFGKQKVYWPNQDEIELPDEQGQKKLEEEVLNLEKELQELQKAAKSAESELKLLQNAPSTIDAKSLIKKLEEENKSLKVKVEKCQSGKLISPDEKKKIEKKYQDSKATWRKRKKLCVEIIATIAEMGNKKPKDLYDKIGVETDEDYKVHPDKDTTSNFLENLKK